MLEHDKLLEGKYGEPLDYDIHSFYQIKPSEALYDLVFNLAAKDNDPYLIILMERTWTRYGGWLGWANCEGATANIFTFRWMPWYIDSWVIAHEMAHTILCRLGREWREAVHNDPDLT